MCIQYSNEDMDRKSLCLHKASLKYCRNMYYYTINEAEQQVKINHPLNLISNNLFNDAQYSHSLGQPECLQLCNSVAAGTVAGTNSQTLESV